MRGVAYALTASLALMVSVLTQASAGCYGECNGYQDNRSVYGAPDGYQRSYYDGARYYDDGPRGHTVYYERGPEIPVSYYERPVYRTAYYDDGYGYNGGYGYGGGYRYGGYGYRGYGGGYVAGCGAYGCGVAGCGRAVGGGRRFRRDRRRA